MPSLKLLVLQEPKRGQRLLSILNDWYNASSFLQASIPLTADIFVFVYPFFLIYTYILGIKEKRDHYKNAALTIFFAALTAIVVNLIIQIIIFKTRPEALLVTQHKLILGHVPSNPFPSDHAALTVAIAVATRRRGKIYAEKRLIKRARVFLGFAFLTCFSRIMGGVHRPTDIIAWVAVGTFCWYAIYFKPVRRRYKNTFFFRIVKREQRILLKLFKIHQ